MRQQGGVREGVAALVGGTLGTSRTLPHCAKHVHQVAGQGAFGVKRLLCVLQTNRLQI